MAYNGSVELISGITQANNGTFPLVDASAVRVDDETRLDEALENVAGIGMRVTNIERRSVLSELGQTIKAIVFTVKTSVDYSTQSEGGGKRGHNLIYIPIEDGSSTTLSWSDSTYTTTRYRIEIGEKLYPLNIDGKSSQDTASFTYYKGVFLLYYKGDGTFDMSTAGGDMDSSIMTVEKLDYSSSDNCIYIQVHTKDDFATSLGSATNMKGHNFLRNELLRAKLFNPAASDLPFKIKISDQLYPLTINGNSTFSGSAFQLGRGQFLIYWDQTKFALDTNGYEATQTSQGFMSAADKTKLDGIDAAANNYVLPDATSSVKGGVMIESTPTENSTKAITSGGVKTALDGKQNTLSFDNTPTQNSSNPVKSGGVYTALQAKQNTLTFDTQPIANSTNPVTSGGVYTALDTKQGTLTFDSAPTANSTNPVTSGGVKTALDGKQNTLTFDTEPTENSTNPVTSGGVYEALEGIQDQLTFDDTPTDGSENPVTSEGIKAYADSVVEVSDEEPTSAGNKLWIDDSELDTYTVPTVAEMNAAIASATPTIPDATSSVKGVVMIEDTPTENSTKAITSGAVYDALEGIQGLLTFDDVPTASSTNPVTSDGIKTAIDAVSSTLDERVPEPTTAGKFLQTDVNGDPTWGNAASVADVVSAAEDWLEENVSGGETIAIDTSLLVSGAAADSKVVGDGLGELRSAFVHTGGESATLTNQMDLGSVGSVYGVSQLSYSDGVKVFKSTGTDVNPTVRQGSMNAGEHKWMVGVKFKISKTDPLTGDPTTIRLYLGEGTTNAYDYTVEYDTWIKYCEIATVDLTRVQISARGYSTAPADNAVQFSIKECFAYNVDGLNDDMLEYIEAKQDSDFADGTVTYSTPSIYFPDDTLTQDGKAADAGSVGAALQEVTKGKLVGLAGVAFGTSLTSRSKNGNPGYLTYLPDLIGVTFDNQGIGSSMIKGNLLTAIKNYEDYSDKRICIIEGFVNDWKYNSQLGTWKDTVETTACGCVRSAINYILSQNANITIFLVLDHYGRNYSSDDRSSTAENNAQLTQFEYYEEISKVAASLGIPVIKQYAESQISENTPQYLADYVHLNALGAKQSANLIASKIKQYYPNNV